MLQLYTILVQATLIYISVGEPSLAKDIARTASAKGIAALGECMCIGMGGCGWICV